MSGPCFSCKVESQDLIRLLYKKNGAKVWSDDSDFTWRGLEDLSPRDYCWQCWAKQAYEEDVSCIQDFDERGGSRCGCCGFRYEDWLFFQCEMCDQSICCINCVAVTGCQTRECVCKACFDGLCIDCHLVPLSQIDTCWIWDADPRPLCENCQRKQTSEESSGEN